MCTHRHTDTQTKRRAPLRRFLRGPPPRCCGVGSGRPTAWRLVPPGGPGGNGCPFAHGLGVVIARDDALSIAVQPESPGFRRRTAGGMQMALTGCRSPRVQAVHRRGALMAQCDDDRSNGGADRSGAHGTLGFLRAFGCFDRGHIGAACVHEEALRERDFSGGDPHPPSPRCLALACWLALRRLEGG